MICEEVLVLANILKIVIKKVSGFCCYNELYEDSITLTDKSFLYEYKPVNETEKNTKKKWKFQTSSEKFKNQFEKICVLVEDTIRQDIFETCTDVGGIEFSVSFSDKTKYKKVFWVSSGHFIDLFQEIKALVPTYEDIPNILGTDPDDFLTKVEGRLNEAKLVVEKLLKSPRLDFLDLKPSDIPESIAGVYAIFDKYTDEVYYVGRTVDIRRRLYTNHLQGPLSTARLKKYLIEDERIPSAVCKETAKQFLKDNCFFRYLSEDNSTRRGQLEGLLSYALNVRYIYEEH